MRRGALLLTSLLLAGCVLAGCASGSGSGPLAGSAGTGRLLVTFHPAPEPSQLRHLQEISETYGLRPVAAWTMESLGELCAVLETPSNVSLGLSARLRAHPGVSSAQPVQRFRALGDRAFDDPYHGLQHGIRDIPLDSIHRHTRGERIRIALVDTGVDISHPDLAGRVVLASNLAPASPESFTEDRHGTALAGIIAAQTDNGEGIVGIAPAAELLALKACWYEKDRPEVAICDSYTLARALDAALSRDVDLINLSLTGPRDPLLARFLDVAADRAIPVVVAVDEEAPDGGFPANRPDVFAVRSAPRWGGAAAPTARPDREGEAWFSGPGIDVLTTAPRAGYDFYSGSSYATAYVTGTLALLLGQRPGLDLDAVRQRLRDGSTSPVDPCKVLFPPACG